MSKRLSRDAGTPVRWISGRPGWIRPLGFVLKSLIQLENYPDGGLQLPLFGGSAHG